MNKKRLQLNDLADEIERQEIRAPLKRNVHVLDDRLRAVAQQPLQVLAELPLAVPAHDARVG